MGTWATSFYKRGGAFGDDDLRQGAVAKNDVPFKVFCECKKGEWWIYTKFNNDPKVVRKDATSYPFYDAWAGTSIEAETGDRRVILTIQHAAAAGIKLKAKIGKKFGDLSIETVDLLVWANNTFNFVDATLDRHVHWGVEKKKAEYYCPKS